MFFIGFTVQCLFTAQASDHFGRKAVLMTSNLAIMICYIVFFFSTSISAFYGAFFMLGVSAGANIMTQSVFVLETVRADLFPIYITVYGTIDTAT